MLIKPMLANVCQCLPEEVDNAIYETKYDGMRIIIENNNDDLGTVLWTRGGKHVNNQFPNIRQEISKQRQFTLDCELVVFDSNRKSDISLLQKRSHTTNPMKISEFVKKLPASLIVFDILALDGEYLINHPLYERKEILDEVLKTSTNIINTPRYTNTSLLMNLDIEGIIVKKLDKPYLPGKRTDNWLKYKFNKEGVFKVVDYELHPKGIVMITSEGHHINCNGKQSVKGKSLIDSGIYFNIEVEFLEITKTGSLRFPSFKRYV